VLYVRQRHHDRHQHHHRAARRQGRRADHPRVPRHAADRRRHAAQRIRRPRPGQPARPGQPRLHRRDPGANRCRREPGGGARRAGRDRGGRRTAREGGRGDRRLLPLVAAAARKRGARGRADRTALPRGVRHPLLRDPAGDPRVGALHDRRLQLPLRAHDDALHRPPLQPPSGRGLPREPLLLPGHRRRRRRTGRPPAADHPARLRARGRGDGLPLPGRADGHRQRPRRRHGRHQLRHRGAQGPRRAHPETDQRQRPADRALDPRHRLGRRRRRQHCGARCPRRPPGRPAQRRLGTGARLLRPGRRRGDGHRRDARPRLPRPRQLPRRSLPTRCRRRPARDRGADRRAPRPLGRRGPPPGSTTSL
jgi:hypothetical protein